MSRKFLMLAILLSLVIYACQKNHSPTEAYTSPKYAGLLAVPDSGYIGSRIHLFGIPFDSLSSNNFGRFVYFTGLKYPVRPYIFTSTDVFVEVPFGARSGPIGFKSEDSSYLFPNFKVLETSPDSGVTVKHYNLNYPILKKDSYMIDFNDALIKWQGTVHADTIILFRKGFCGDECTFKDIIKLLDTHSDLPEFLEATRNDTIHCCFYSTYNDTVKAGILKIQDYDAHGLISGRIFYRNKLNTPTSFVFWYDFKR